MKRLIPIFLAVPLVLAACQSEDTPAPVESTTSSSSAPSTTSTSSSASSSSEQKTSELSAQPVQEPEPAPAKAEPIPESEPYIVECLFGTPGPSLMSDGTTRNTEYCGNQPGAQEHRDAESAAGYDPTKNYEDPQLPAYLTRTPEESRQQAEGQGWWSNCMATNTAEYCRATDPYQQ
ncbi:hypothetical protein VVR26_07135 [Corynebacterium camporealensis]|uniref:hypothetical protein n=1 Tax=Corynebacterium camporealensis TaxID=161896 RepID=UPI0034CDBF33